MSMKFCHGCGKEIHEFAAKYNNGAVEKPIGAWAKALAIVLPVIVVIGIGSSFYKGYKARHPDTIATIGQPDKPSPSANTAASTAVPVEAPTAQQPISLSFDCTKASTNAERLICSSPELAVLDVEMMQAYDWLAGVTPDKKSLKKEQNDWRKNQRDICSTIECMANAYHARTDDLAAKAQYLSKPAEFR